MSVSFSAEMSDKSMFRVVCACGAYQGVEISNFKSARFAADLFNSAESKSHADCMDGCESQYKRYYVQEISVEVNMSNANAGLFFGMMSVDEESRYNGGSMEAGEFFKKIQDIGKFAVEGSYVSEKVAQLSEVAVDAMSKGVKVCWG